MAWENTTLPKLGGGPGKVSISLSAAGLEALRRLAHDAEGNASAIVEAALRLFDASGQDVQRTVIRETRALKRSLTRSGWMNVFWSALADEFGTEDTAAERGQRTLAPRSYGDFQIVFLLDPVTKPLSEDLHLHIMQSAVHSSRIHLGENHNFSLEDSVYEAARWCADWIRARTSSGETAPSETD